MFASFASSRQHDYIVSHQCQRNAPVPTYVMPGRVCVMHICLHKACSTHKSEHARSGEAHSSTHTAFQQCIAESPCIAPYPGTQQTLQ